MLGTSRIHPGRPKKQVIFPTEAQFDRLNAPGAGNLKQPAEAALEANIRDNLLRTAMLMQHLGAPLSRQFAQLHGLVAIANSLRRQRYGKLNRFTF